MYHYAGNNPVRYTDPDGSNIATAFLKGFGLSLYSDIQSFSEFIAYTSIGSFFGGELGEMVGIAVYGIKTDIELYNTIVDNWPEITEFLHNPVDYVKNAYLEMSAEDKAEFLGGITEKIAVAIILSKATGGSGKTYNTNGNDLNTIKSLDDFITNPKKLANTTGTDLYNYLLKNGYDVKPLSKGSYKGIPFTEGGGFKVNWGGDRILQYHPESLSHHGGAYYKLSSGNTGTLRMDLNGNIIE